MGIVRRALNYFKPEWRYILIVMAIITITTGLDLLMAWPMATMVDAVLTATPRHTEFSIVLLSWLPEGQLGQLVGLTAIGVLLKILREACEGARVMVQSLVNYRGLTRLRGELFRKILSLDMGWHRTQPQGDAIYRMNFDTWRGPQEILQTLTQVFLAAMKVVVMFGIMALACLELAIASASLVFPLMLASIYFSRKLKVRQSDVKSAESALVTATQHTMGGAASLVQAYGREAQEHQRFELSLAEFIRKLFRFNWVDVAYNFTLGSTLAIGAAVVFGYGGYLVYRDQILMPRPNGMTLGVLLAFGAYLGMLYDPLTRLTGAPAALQGALVSTRRVFSVLDTESAVSDPPEGQAMQPAPRTLTLRGVHVAWGEAATVVHDINATVRPGQMVAFVGPSGAGKSTVLGLLPRFYDPTAGVVALDGIDLRDIRLADLRRHIALVPQDAVTLPTTVEENIRYGCESASPEEVRAAAQTVGAEDFIDSLPAGYATVIAEGGANLSGGQKQRIALARALLSAAPFLVLDEPTGSLDSNHERQVIAALESLKGRKTVVMVTHRLNTVVNCDQIFVLDSGRIAEHGTHEELLRRNGVYAQMVRKQREEDREEFVRVA